VKHHWLTWDELKSQFPKDGEFKYGMRPAQEQGLRFVADQGSSVLELPTGSGKTAMEVTIARTAAKHGQKCFVVAPTKTIVDQIVKRFPDDFTVALGRNSYPCFYYEKDKQGLGDPERQYKHTADDVPTSLCRLCPHYVDQETGQVKETAQVGCPYYLTKYQARVSKKPVLATLSFYLFSRLFSKSFDQPDALIIDEAHRLAETVRSALSYDITDWHLEKAAEILQLVDEDEPAAVLTQFRKKMIKIVKAIMKSKTRRSRRGSLLYAEEIKALISILEGINIDSLSRSVSKAIIEETLDVEDDLEALKKVENVVHNLRRYLYSLGLSLPTADRDPLAYTYAYYVEEKGEHDRVEHKLVVCSHRVAPLVEKYLLGNITVGLSATIGNNVIYGQESGIKFPFLSVEPSFPAERTRIFMPTDTPNLAYNERKSGTVTNVMRRMARAAKRLSKSGLRSLYVVVSNEERQKLLALMAEEGVNAISYGNGVTAREAALRFKEGEGDCLVGTASNFGEGVDLPRQIAPVIFGLRPAYPPPDDPRTQFEERRYGNNHWAIWNWRVMLSVLQWRGRNIRSEDDLGVTIFISQRFRRSVFAALPKTLQSSYKGDLTLDQCVKEAEKMLK
jgi:Rad3-related DNA helicase